MDGARGRASVVFASATKLNPLELLVTDTASDGQHARIRLQVNSTSLNTSWVKAVGYGDDASVKGPWGPGMRIDRVRIEVCRYNGDVRKDCAWSQWQMSPWA
ncbi:hypothetical protein [Streptomyces mesophilus]|uniref:hypothetical protein n=1 Tax=Streptomyces mesophilus TaxID=1775132 RepID=UPI003329C4EF